MLLYHTFQYKNNIKSKKYSITSIVQLNEYNELVEKKNTYK